MRRRYSVPEGGNIKSTQSFLLLLLLLLFEGSSVTQRLCLFRDSGEILRRNEKLPQEIAMHRWTTKRYAVLHQVVWKGTRGKERNGCMEKDSFKL